MRFEMLNGDELIRQIGAAVVREDGAGLIIEFGPADGPPMNRLRLSSDEAHRLLQAVRTVLNGKHEEIILADD
jgi:hypothetical protein